MRHARAITLGLNLGLSLGFAAPGFAEPAPSGLDWSLQEVIFEPVGAGGDAVQTVRLRYVSPLLTDAESYGFDVIEGDFVYFCEGEGLHQVMQFAPLAQQIIVSVSSHPVAFGETAPDIVQYFEAFRSEGNACIWDGS